jgi:hypothetical protein
MHHALLFPLSVILLIKSLPFTLAAYQRLLLKRLVPSLEAPDQMLNADL